MLLLKYVNTLLIQTNNNDLKGAIGHLFFKKKVKLCCTPLLIMGRGDVNGNQSARSENFSTTCKQI